MRIVYILGGNPNSLTNCLPVVGKRVASKLTCVCYPKEGPTFPMFPWLSIGSSLYLEDEHHIGLIPPCWLSWQWFRWNTVEWRNFGRIWCKLSNSLDLKRNEDTTVCRIGKNSKFTQKNSIFLLVDDNAFRKGLLSWLPMISRVGLSTVLYYPDPVVATQTHC